jgi:hypothetical protein
MDYSGKYYRNIMDMVIIKSNVNKFSKRAVWRRLALHSTLTALCSKGI